MNQTLRRPKPWILILFMMLLGAASLTAQDRTVRGKVTDVNGEAIPGATVTIKGTTTGTVADVDGNFSLTVSGKTPFWSFRLRVTKSKKS